MSDIETQRLIANLVPEGARVLEIGRASCRERVL